MPGKSREDGLDDELRFHIDEQVRAYRARGLTEQEARRRVRIEFGGVDEIKDACRDVRWNAWLADAGRDLGHALRGLRRSPGFAAVALTTLALCTGANTAVFSLVHEILLAYLPVSAPEQLVVVSRTNLETSRNTDFPYPFFQELEAETAVFSGVLSRGGTERVTVGLETGGEPALGELVSGSYFDVLGVKPHLGRLLSPDDDVTPGAHPVVVLSYGYWQRRCGADPRIVGRTLTLSGYSMTVIGVSPPGFLGLDPGQSVDLRVPLAMQAELRRAPLTLSQRSVWGTNIVARLRPGVTLAEAEQRSSGAWRRYLDEGAPASSGAERASERINLLPAATGFGKTRRQFQVSLLALLSITGAVLFVACLNLANLLLARHAARRHEFAVRRALGAGTGRLARQLLTETLVLALAGGAFGMLLAAIGTKALVSAASGSAWSFDQDAGWSGTVVLFHLGIAILCGLLLGLAPVLSLRNERLAPAMRQAAGSPRLAAVRKALVSAQVALSVVVLAGAGMFLQTIHALRTVDVGFRPDHLLVLALSPANAGRSQAEVLPFFRAVREQVSAMPGVRSVTYATVRALSSSSWSGSVVIEGVARADSPSAFRNAVGPAYFETLGMPLLAGRDFNAGDDPAAPRVAVVSESFARSYFPGQDPLGRKIGVSQPDHTIVGVARDAKYAHVREAGAARVWYVPYEQQARVKYLDLYVRTAGDPEQLAPAVRAAIASVDKGVALFNVRTQEAQIEELLLAERMLAALASALGATAAALVGLGLFGVLVFLANERRREIGIRVALGARPAAVMRLVAGEVALWVAFGLLVGVPAAAVLGRHTEAILFGVKPIDPASLLGAALIMGSVAVLATVVPACRAARSDPLAALRDS